MSLVFCDGFDYTTGGINPANYGKWSASQANLQLSNSHARTGSYSLSNASSHAATKSLQTKDYTSEFVTGIAIKLTANNASAVLHFYENGTTTLHGGLTFNADGSVTVIGRGTGLVATSPWTCGLMKWAYVELKMKIHDTTGYYELRVDDRLVLSATNVDTRNAGAVGRVETIRIGAGSTLFMDDFYFVNVDSIAPNDFLGPVAIHSIFPNASGTYSEWTRSTGTVNYTNVDEIPPSMTDYNQSTVSGQYDTYNFGNLGANVSGIVQAVVLNNYALYASPNPQHLSNVVISSGYTQASGNVALATSAGWYQVPFPKTPTSGQWTISGVNNAEFGVLSALS